MPLTVCVLILYAYFKFTIRNIPCAVSRDYVIGIRVSIISERAKRVRHPLLLPIEKKFGRKYVKTTMRMLTNFT